MTQSAAISLKSRASGAGTGVDDRRSVVASAAGTVAVYSVFDFALIHAFRALYYRYMMQYAGFSYLYSCDM